MYTVLRERTYIILMKTVPMKYQPPPQMINGPPLISRLRKGALELHLCPLIVAGSGELLVLQVP